VSQPPKPRHPGPPHNPGVRDLVEGKRRWSSPPKAEDAKQGFRGWHERGYLPHRDEPGLTQFVTFHLADSFPASLRSEWQHFAKIEDDRKQRELIEAYLDNGRGECHLRKPEIAKLVENNFREFDTGRLANKLLGKRGAFWAEDYFDTYMRDAEHEAKTLRYIENNPTKAKLVLDPKDWPWSSARFRDEYGVLRL